MAKHKPKYRRTVPKKKRRISRLTSTLMVIALMSALLTAAMTIGAVAKYSHQSGGEAIVRAREFYFTSDYLMPGGKLHKLNQTTNEALTVQFELRNYEGLNVSELDIHYDIQLNSNDKTATLSANKGTISRNGKNENKVVITLSGLKAGCSYEVIATGRNGYSKTLSAAFEVLESTENIHKNTTKYKDYVILTIWTDAIAAENLTVSVPAGLIPDRTNTNLRNVGNSFTVSLAKYSSVAYRFFTAGGYDGSPITVTKNNTPLSETSLS